MRRVEYLRVNEVVIQEGQKANCVILIKEGQFKIVKSNFTQLDDSFLSFMEQ